MTHERHAENQNVPETPQLTPTGSVDEVLLTGGKNLTLFQSVALVITGFAIALGVGTMILAFELSQESFSREIGHPYRSYSDWFVGCAMILWGLVIVAYGIIGIVKALRRRRRMLED